MIKSFFKELVITILLCAAIVCVMAVVFYEYNPMNKIVPTPVAYSTPKNVTTALNEYKETTGNEQVFEKEKKVYTIDENRLEEYKRAKSYDPGKIDPFANVSQSAGGDDSTGSGTPVGNISTPGNSGTTYYNETGKK